MTIHDYEDCINRINAAPQDAWRSAADGHSHLSLQAYGNVTIWPCDGTAIHTCRTVGVFVHEFSGRSFNFRCPAERMKIPARV
jgi:hypothetical protein